MTPREYTTYLGKGGQFAVMSHIVVRGYNVAIPEIDVGSDIFVVQDENSTLWRVQVKTATAIANADGSLRAKFNLPERQLRNLPEVDDLIYSLVVLHEGVWRAFINLPRAKLEDATAGMKPTKGALTPTLRLSKTQVLCNAGKADLQQYRDWWEYWPDLRRS
ncbi:hypothetical protein [Nannocystis sp. SCPEA4]|uniref:hypothetical protein n=1 Tax=Nannocystis sp. SCPEA4 TaxID=2996787 RepID=UPI00226D6594|nr:hypothetical protein [Nannocystis sp. SCPEA4]MCY1055699.1 hypothetical protein [Nannocystis sp. SCPEA4]